jgi:radical SAM family uncharacterized protein
MATSVRSVDFTLIEDHILPRVLNPGRYIGGELNRIVKDWQHADVHMVLCFPDVYEIGMSYTVGFGILYKLVNALDFALAERAYAPWPDFEAALREHGQPLYSLESRHSLGEFEVVGFTLQYELHYTNILTMLDLAGIPLRAEDRGDDDPFVIVGGPCAYNCESAADFFDCVLAGDGERALPRFLKLVRETKGLPRRERLKIFAREENIYVPSFYRPIWGQGEHGWPRFQGMERLEPEARASITPALIEDLDPANYPDEPLVPIIEATFTRLSVEVMRGCSRGCRFCHAGMVYRPVRQRKPEDVLAQARKSLEKTGFKEVSLLSLSTGDYEPLHEFLDMALDELTTSDTALSFPSLRTEMFTPRMAQAASSMRTSGMTFAPEAGTERLRAIINKGNTDTDLYAAVRTAFEYGWRSIKLYFMIGLPFETDDDIRGIVETANQVARIGRRFGKVKVKAAISPHSPKPNTPFQWFGQPTTEEFHHKVAVLRGHRREKEVHLDWRDPEVAYVEDALARGDRRISRVIEQAWRNGARFDAWTQQFRYEDWVTAFTECGLDLAEFTRARGEDEILPWEHTSGHLKKRFLLKSWHDAQKEVWKPDCRREPLRCLRGLFPRDGQEGGGQPDSRVTAHGRAPQGPGFRRAPPAGAAHGAPHPAGGLPQGGGGPFRGPPGPAGTHEPGPGHRQGARGLEPGFQPPDAAELRPAPAPGMGRAGGDPGHRAGRALAGPGNPLRLPAGGPGSGGLALQRGQTGHGGRPLRAAAPGAGLPAPGGGGRAAG